MGRLFYRPAARVDLAEIYRFIAADDPSQARRFVETVRARIRSLTE